ncbi:MAG: hypothetical protein Q4F75_00635 [Pseudomonadota bacterium]|nr:hypothetical protein [Pseudomonadota bacterium]
MSVYLTVGRHAAYEMMSAFPITSFGIADTGLLCPLLVRQAKKVDAIFYSPTPRCAATAQVISLMTDCTLLFKDNRLCEGATKKDSRAFYEEVVQKAQENNWEHIHVVTHLYNVNEMLYDDTRCMPDVEYSRWVVRQADCWEDMLKPRGFVDVPPQYRAECLKLIGINDRFSKREAMWKAGIDDEADYDRSLSLAAKVLDIMDMKLAFDETVDEILAHVKRSIEQV